MGMLYQKNGRNKTCQPQFCYKEQGVRSFHSHRTISWLLPQKSRRITTSEDKEGSMSFNQNRGMPSMCQKKGRRATHRDEKGDKSCHNKAALVLI
jgi:hypothetical protein